MSVGTTLTITETEGATRWSVTLGGRAGPKLDKDTPRFGVMPGGADTFYRGNPLGRYEPTTLKYAPLILSGSIRRAHLALGLASVAFTPQYSVTTPQDVCDRLRQMAKRQKTVLVELPGSGAVIARWEDCWSEQEKRAGDDRAWGMQFVVLGDHETAPVAMPPVMSSSQHLGAMQASGRALDLALASQPFVAAQTGASTPAVSTPSPSLNESFLERIQDAFGDARAQLSAIRAAIATAGSLATLPASLVQQFTSLGMSAAETLIEARQTFDAIPIENQVAFQQSEYLFKATAWRISVQAATDAALDDVFVLLDALAAKTQPTTYVAVNGGELLSNVARRVYGPNSAGLWTKIADANGLSGQIVPYGVSQLIVPQVA